MLAAFPIKELASSLGVVSPWIFPPQHSASWCYGKSEPLSTGPTHVVPPFIVFGTLNKINFGSCKCQGQYSFPQFFVGSPLLFLSALPRSRIVLTPFIKACFRILKSQLWLISRQKQSPTMPHSWDKKVFICLYASICFFNNTITKFDFNFFISDLIIFSSRRDDEDVILSFVSVLHS